MYTVLKHIVKFFKRVSSENSGNTLIEIPIVLAIVTGGMTLTASAAVDVLHEARDVRRAADAYQVTTALAFYYNDNSAYPQYAGTDPETSWELLRGALEPNYIQELPDDPDPDSGKQYRYWSDNQIAKVFYTVESDNSEKVRWSY